MIRNSVQVAAFNHNHSNGEGAGDSTWYHVFATKCILELFSDQIGTLNFLAKKSLKKAEPISGIQDNSEQL